MKIDDKLQRLKLPPMELHVKGLSLAEYDDRLIIAVVGSRKLSPYGLHAIEKLVPGLVKRGAAIVSGLAFGADIAAHRAALGCGGQTIAVLPSGIDTVYPVSHTDDAKRICQENGTLVSEYSGNHRPHKVDFLHRNRIIAALSDLVIIPEASKRSGSLNTARNAKEIGVPVCTIPGDIRSPLSAGTNSLLSRGEAHAVLSANDVLKHVPAQLIAAEPKQKVETLQLNLPDQEVSLLGLIKKGVTNPTELGLKMGLEPGQLQQSITTLEIEGRVEVSPDGSLSLR